MLRDWFSRFFHPELDGAAAPPPATAHEDLADRWSTPALGRLFDSHPVVPVGPEPYERAPAPEVDERWATPSPGALFMRSRPDLYPYVPEGASGLPEQRNDHHRPPIAPDWVPGSERPPEHSGDYPYDPQYRGEWGIYAPPGTAGTQPPDDSADVELANSRNRPPLYMSPTGRIINLPEWVRWHTWLNNQEVLRNIDPKNPQLQSIYSPGWVPSERDLETLRTEILTQREARGLGPAWHGHHPLVNMLSGVYWGQGGISRNERELQLNFLPEAMHIGRGGIHPWWERELQARFGEYPRLNRRDIYNIQRDELYNFNLLREK